MNRLYVMEVEIKMGSRSIKPYANVQFRQFKEAMKELAKNKNLTLDAAEKAIGLEADFTEQVFRGIKELTLADVIKISKYFNTTMDSVLDGGNYELRMTKIYSFDELSSQYFEECLNLYVQVLDIKNMSFWKSSNWIKRIQEKEAKLEAAEQRLMERFKKYMDESESRTDKSITVSNCCDEVLISELIKRGFKVEKGKENGETANKSSR